uniref:Putative ovule protein n=1 Tax=Solanum chacoense TaxID=4108 RepID=A0A0V0IAL5_SOLCH
MCGGGALEVMECSMCDLFMRLLVREKVKFPRNAIWAPSVTRKVCFFFTSLATRGVISIAKNLRKWKDGCISWCYRNKETGKDVDHLLLHYRLSMRLWWNMFLDSSTPLG